MARTPFKMSGMSFKGEAPVRKIDVGKFVKSRVNRVVDNVKNVVDRVKSITDNNNSNSTKTSDDDDIMLINGENISNSETAQTNANETTTSEVPEAGVDLERVKAGPVARRKKKPPTRNYKKGLGSYKSMKKIKKK